MSNMNFFSENYLCFERTERDSNCSFLDGFVLRRKSCHKKYDILIPIFSQMFCQKFLKKFVIFATCYCHVSFASLNAIVSPDSPHPISDLTEDSIIPESKLLFTLVRRTKPQSGEAARLGR